MNCPTPRLARAQHSHFPLCVGAHLLRQTYALTMWLCVRALHFALHFSCCNDFYSISVYRIKSDVHRDGASDIQRDRQRSNTTPNSNKSKSNSVRNCFPIAFRLFRAKHTMANIIISCSFGRGCHFSWRFYALHLNGIAPLYRVLSHIISFSTQSLRHIFTTLRREQQQPKNARVAAVWIRNIKGKTSGPINRQQNKGEHMPSRFVRSSAWSQKSAVRHKCLAQRNNPARAWTFFAPFLSIVSYQFIYLAAEHATLSTTTTFTFGVV